MTEPSVAIIVLNWNGLENTIDTIESIYKIDYTNYKIILVDNNSDEDPEPELIKRFPNIKFIQTGENKGYAGGNNIGIKWAIEKGFQYVCILNNDVLVEKDFLSVLVDFMESRKDVAVTAPIIKMDSKDIEGIKIENIFLGLMRYVRESEKSDKGYRTDIIIGTAFLARTEVMKNNLIPEFYFMYCEDLEWSYKLIKQGYGLYVVPKSKVFHKSAMSTGGELSYFSLYMISRNRPYFFERNVSIISAFISLLTNIIHLLRILLGFFKKPTYENFKYKLKVFRKSAKPILSGSLDYIRRKKGNPRYN